MMSYAIVGFGKIGEALAHAFARKNIDLLFSKDYWMFDRIAFGL